jgi:hypothetical protein
MPSTLAERLDRLVECEAATERVDRHVCAAAGCVLDGLSNLLGRESMGVDGGCSALVACLCELAVGFRSISVLVIVNLLLPSLPIWPHGIVRR